MKKQKNSKALSLKEQIAYWDRKLAESEFEDIEDRNTGRLKTYSGTKSISTVQDKVLPGSAGYSSILWKKSQAEYYRLAGHFLYSGEFKNKRHKSIWTLHCQGRSMREIAKNLRITLKKVRYAIECLEIDFGLKMAQTDTSEVTNGSDHDKSKDQSTNYNPRRGTR